MWNSIILHLRNILSLNERFAYSLVGIMRLSLMPLFNSFLNLQKRSVRKKLINKETIIREQLINMLPQVNRDNFLEFLTEDECNHIISEANEILLHRFKIFSIQINFEDNIDWQLDFNSGF